MPEPASIRGSTMATSIEVSPPEEYFRGVSPLCRRLLDDMKAVRESWGDNWDNMSYHQQCRVIDQAIVDEATVRKYDDGAGAGTECEGPECEYFPKLKLTTGQKVVCDENLTARGFSCSWRDEHSAPFSWHTRSQMDLTLDTPPATPTHPGTPMETPPTTIAGEGRIIPGGRAVYTARPVSLPRPPRFRWHYDPPEEPPEPPSIVVAAPRSATLPHPGSDAKKSPIASKFLLVRGRGDGSEGSGLLARIKGAVTALTATCLPLRATQGQTSLFYLPSDPEYTEPELKQPEGNIQPLYLPSNKNEAPSYPGSKLSVDLGDGRAETSGHTLPSLSRLSPDPTLAGYVCSLPDDDDDVPYTVAQPRGSSFIQPNTPGARSRDALLTPGTPSSGERTPKYEEGICLPPLPVDLPTPLPTPTVSDCAKTVSTVLSRPTSSSTCAPSPSHLDDTLSAISEPDSSTDALDTPREEQPLLKVERRKKSNESEDDAFSSVLAANRESNIPKTGFDFLDDW